jgi:hypothetical protein
VRKARRREEEEGGDLEDDGDGDDPGWMVAFRSNKLHSFKCTSKWKISE